MTKAGMSCLTSAVAMMRSKAIVLALALGAFLPGTSYATQIFLTTGSSWTVPSDWNDSNNTIEVIGGGGGGGSGNTTPNQWGGGGGGGGGAYSKATNIPLSPGTSVSFSVGVGGAGGAAGGGAGGAGADTWFCNATINCASITGSAVVAGAKAGSGGSASGTASGGASASGVGSTKNSGGNGGAGQWAISNGGSGGGGAGGPLGPGGNGAISSPVGGYGGGGGGGNGGGSAGTTSSIASQGGNGGNNNAGSGGGTGAPAKTSTLATAGTNGGGGGGGNWNNLPSAAAANGANGGAGADFDLLHGSGGGGGGAGDANTSPRGVGGAAGNYGGGGGGGVGDGLADSAGGAGAQGIIVITYAPLSAPPPPTASATRIFLTSGTSWTVPSNWNVGNNTIEVIGGGGGGGSTTPGAGWGGGGGGGAYSKTSNVPLTPGSSVTLAIGAGGGNATTGGDTYFCNSTANCTGIAGSAVVVGAKGGAGGQNGPSGGNGGGGGAATSGVGSLKTSGGSGGPGYSVATDSGGGAGGPHGNGNPGTGSSGGSGDAGFGGAGALPGSNGPTGTEWDSAHGSGGGGGRGTGGGVPSPTGGLYGGGGGAGVDNGSSTVAGGSGAQGIIVITYVPLSEPTPPPPSSSTTRTSSFAYDPASGLLTQEVVEPNTSSLRLETDYVYDAYGNKTSVTVKGVDIATRSSTKTYDARGQFVTSNANALGQSESWQYDSRFGTPTSHTGPNGLTTTWSYDTFGRKILETRADGTQTKWVYQFCSGVNGGTATCLSGASYLIQSTPYASDGATPNGPTSIVYLDALDREIGRDTQGFDGSTVRATKAYDSFGRVSQTSRPYFANGGAVELTTFTYDALGRVVKVTAPDNSVSQTDYHGLTVTDVNTLNQSRTVNKNSQGKVVSVTDALGQTMTYAYDAVGNMTQTTDAVGNVVTASYDLRGRKIASNDPDLGNWTYTYDTLGELTSQTDAKGQLTTISYDLLSRTVQRVEADMTCIWVYDSAANGIGKLASSSITAGPGSGFARSLSYDALGRAVQVATTISGTTYTMSAAYDANSRLTQVNYPSGFTAKYSYTTLGFANQLQDASSGLAYWTANAMDASGHITQQTSGNGLATTRTFDPTTGRLTGISTGSSGAVQNVSYTYDQLGNPLSRSDVNTGLNETFVYDPLNRLTQSTVNLSTPLVKTFSYSAVGNLLTKSDVGNYNYPAPGSPQPHAVTSLSGGTISTTFTYDSNGNQTSGLGRSITYSSYNKPSSITQGTQTISFLDDTEHQRFQQVTPSGTTLYIAGFGVLAELSGAGTTAAQWTDYLAVGNAKVGMRVLQTASETLNTRYFHTDHLGSISVITDENSNVLERLSYDAWGKRRFPNGSDDSAGSITSQTTRGFTGEEELSVSGLVHLNGRVYDPLLARFTSADPSVTDPLNPQGWNRYSYVGNDPLAFTDPNGFSWLSGFFHSVANFFTHNPIARAILQIGATIFLNAVLPGLGLGLAAGTFGLAVASAAGGAAIAAGLSGGNLGQVLKAGLIAGLTAAAFFEVGSLTYGPAHASPAFDSPNFNAANFAENVAGHALVGCAQSAASGGSCKSGALSGAIGSALAPVTNSLFPDARTDLGQKIGGTIIQATAGGLASVAGGGKFANGAITGAFGYLFNDLSVDDKGKFVYSPSTIGVGEIDIYQFWAEDPSRTYWLAAVPVIGLGAPILFGGAGADALVTVIHFTSEEGVAAIEGGSLRAGSFVALPGEVSGLTASEVEAALEIQAGRGAFSYTFQTPASNLLTPFNGPLTSGLRTQFQLLNPVRVSPGSFIPVP